MKRTITAIICFILCVTFAITAFAKTYTLPERMSLQLEWGSGLKGVINADFEGDGEIARLFSGINGKKISIRGIRDKNEQSLYYAYEADPDDEEHLINLTQLYSSEKKWYLKSKLLDNIIYELTDLKDHNTDGTEPTPSILPVFASFLPNGNDSLNTIWDDILGKYGLVMENWLSGFAGIPEIRKLDDGESIMTFTYTIPEEEIIREIGDLADLLLADTSVTGPISTKLTEEQSDIYLNSNLLYYYRDALAAIHLNEPVRMKREMTSKGDVIQTDIELPVPAGNPIGLQKVSITAGKDLTVYRFAGKDEEWSCGCTELNKDDENAAYEGILTRRSMTGDKGCFSVRWFADMKRTAAEDESGKKTDDIIWTIRTEPAPELIPEADDPEKYNKDFSVSLEVGLNYSGKNANTSPTTLKVIAGGNIGTTKVNTTATFKTSGSWVITPPETGKSIPYGNLIRDDIISSVGDMIRKLTGTVSDENE